LELALNKPRHLARWRGLPTSLLLSLVLLLSATLSHATVGAAPAVAGAVSIPSPEGTYAAVPEAADLDVIQQAFNLLMDRFVQPPKAPDLLNAGYAGVVKRLTELGVSVKSPGPLTLDAGRDQAWKSFATGLTQLLVESPPPAEFDLKETAISAMARSFDEGHTWYLTPERYRDYLAYIRGDVQYSGIGVRAARPEITIAEVFPASPAQAAGLHVGDQIRSVNGESTQGKALDQAAQLIRGPEGTQVVLEIDRPRTGEHLTFTITRSVVKLQFITTNTIQHDIAYVRLLGFADASITDQFEQYLEGLPAMRPRGLVIDLRGNGGGRIDQGIRLLNRFIASGPLFEQVDRSGRRRVQNATGPGWANPIPVAILIDGGTASMAEMFASAMKEHGVARLIGTKTSGSVAASQVFPLQDGAGLQLAIQEIYSPKGEPLNRVGVSPDHVIETPLAEAELGRDLPLEAAVLYLWQESDKLASQSTPR
jgi:carboxyl-terminal processing protease